MFRFDEIQNYGRITIDAFNNAIGNAIPGTDDLIMAFQTEADAGHQLIDEANKSKHKT